MMFVENQSQRSNHWIVTPLVGHNVEGIDELVQATAEPNQALDQADKQLVWPGIAWDDQCLEHIRIKSRNNILGKG